MIYKYETHLHTAESSRCATGTGAEMVRAFHAAGYAGIVVTDHFINDNTTANKKDRWQDQMRAVGAGYHAALNEGKKLGLDVFFGWEMPHTAFGHDYLIYNVGFDFLLANPNLHALEMDDFCELIHQQGGFISRAHPFRQAPYIKNPATITPEWIDGLEVNNGYSDDPDNFNEKAWEYSRSSPSLIRLSGGDTHDIDKVGIAGMAFPNRLENSQHFVELLKADKGLLIINGLLCDKEGEPIVQEESLR